MVYRDNAVRTHFDPMYCKIRRSHSMWVLDVVERGKLSGGNKWFEWCPRLIRLHHLLREVHGDNTTVKIYISMAPWERRVFDCVEHHCGREGREVIEVEPVPKTHANKAIGPGSLFVIGPPTPKRVPKYLGLCRRISNFLGLSGLVSWCPYDLIFPVHPRRGSESGIKSLLIYQSTGNVSDFMMYMIWR